MSKIHVNRAGSGLGQFTWKEVDAGLKTGQFLPSDLAWRDGMPQWKKLGEWTDFSDDLTGVVVMPAVESEGASARESVERTGPAWEQHAELGFVPSIIATVKEILLNPTIAFARMKLTGGLRTPLTFYVITSSIGGGVAILYQMGMKLSGHALAGQAGENFVGSVGFLSLYLMLLPIIMVLSLFMYSLIIQGCLWLVQVRDTSYESIFRLCAYASGSTAVLSVVPFFGGMVGTVWCIVLMIIGLTKVLPVTTGKSAAAVLLPLAFCCVLGIGAALLTVWAGYSGALH